MVGIAENPRAVVGANNPPDSDPLLVEAQERIDTANRYLTERGDLDQWTAEIADKAQFFIGQIAATHSALDEQRLGENREWDTKQEAKYGKTGDLKKGRPGSGPLGLLALAKAKLENLRRGWLQRQEDELRKQREAKEAEAKRLADAAAEVVRKAEEEAKKKGGDPLRAQMQAEEAKQKAEDAAKAAADAPVRAQIKGTFTSTAKGLTTRWSAEITDLSAAFKHFNKTSNPHKATLTRAIEACILDIAKKEAVRLKDVTAAPPGIKFTSERV